MCLVLGNVHSWESVPPWPHSTLTDHRCCHRCLQPWTTEVSYLTQTPLSHYREQTGCTQLGDKAWLQPSGAEAQPTGSTTTICEGLDTTTPALQPGAEADETHMRTAPALFPLLFLSAGPTLLSFTFRGCPLPLSSSCFLLGSFIHGFCLWTSRLISLLN